MVPWGCLSAEGRLDLLGPNRAPGGVCGESFLQDWAQTTKPTRLDHSNTAVLTMSMH
jgi:hypothetical protein